MTKEKIFPGPNSGTFKHREITPPDDIVDLFRRWEGLREVAERVLQTHVVLTPSSDGLHIRVSKKTGLATQTITFFVDSFSVREAEVDVVSLNILQGIKDVGGFNALH